jgi:hypothetical protein
MMSDYVIFWYLQMTFETLSAFLVVKLDREVARVLHVT